MELLNTSTNPQHQIKSFNFYSVCFKIKDIIAELVINLFKCQKKILILVAGEQAFAQRNMVCSATIDILLERVRGNKFFVDFSEKVYVILPSNLPLDVYNLMS